MKGKGGYIYFMSNKSRRVLYLGVTSNLIARVHQHQSGVGSVFTGSYKCKDLVYYEFVDSIVQAITLEKQIKKWTRKKKEDLIRSFNPEMRDLSNEIEGFD